MSATDWPIKNTPSDKGCIFPLLVIVASSIGRLLDYMAGARI